MAMRVAALLPLASLSELFGYEVFVCEAFVLHVLDDVLHLVYRVSLSDFAPCCEFVEIAG